MKKIIHLKNLRRYPVCACGAKNYNIVLDFVKDDRSYQIIRCQRCGLARTWPIPVQKEEIFYQAQTDFLYRKKQLNLWQTFAKTPLMFLKKYRQSGKLLDIGCDLGIFVKGANLAGFDAYGIDLSEKAVEEGRRTFGLEKRLMAGDLKSTNFSSASFDIVTLIHTLEHIIDLNNIFSQVYRVLKKDGIILIETPNFDSLWRKLLKAKWYGLSPSQHIWQFSSGPLKRLLESQNFSCLEINTRYNMYHKVTLNFKGFIKLIIIFLTRLFHKGDNLIIIAQKK